jgi:hypothetical protein
MDIRNSISRGLVVVTGLLLLGGMGCLVLGDIAEECPACNGTGQVNCPECGGARVIDCPLCVAGCVSCDFTGTVNCPTCDGLGKVTCSRCYGKGTIE